MAAFLKNVVNISEVYVKVKLAAAAGAESNGLFGSFVKQKCQFWLVRLYTLLNQTPGTLP
jgi:hypothetical protein